MQTQTNLKQRWLLRGLGVTTLAAFALISACGGGGSVSFDPTSTPTATPTPLPYAVLHSFAADGSEGDYPRAQLVADSAGDFYGLTHHGGTSYYGTAFKITRTGTFSLLHTFTAGSDGANPYSALVPGGASNFYGTTYSGGVKGRGTVFKMTSTGIVTVLHNFGDVGDGIYPYAGLVPDGAGNFYGTTEFGGTNDKGTVFKMDSAEEVTILHSFGAVGDGAGPTAPLVPDGSGNFYGTTQYGGTDNKGTVFKMTDLGIVTVLHSFGPSSGSDGTYPFAGLVLDSAGNLYGTTVYGGANEFGTVFKITKGGDFELLHTFASVSDGTTPLGTLLPDGLGNFYGTTVYGGTNNKGTVFKITNTGVFTLLHSFGGLNDGISPYAGLVSDGAGNLYGTTISGGANDLGTVFRIPMQ